MDPRRKQSILKKVTDAKKRITKERDKLRDFISELGAIENDCTDAVDSLEYAADALSRLL